LTVKVSHLFLILLVAGALLLGLADVIQAVIGLLETIIELLEQLEGAVE
jgi:hypothetical protein